MLVNSIRTSHSLPQILLPTALLHPRRVRKVAEQLEKNHKMLKARLAKERQRQEAIKADEERKKALEKLSKTDPAAYQRYLEAEQQRHMQIIYTRGRAYY